MLYSLKTSIISLIMLTFTFVAYAQKKYDSGLMVLETQTDQTPKSDVKLSFTGDLTQLDIEQGPVIIKVVNSHNDKKTLVLVDIPMMQKQYATIIGKEDTEKAEAMMPKYTDFVATGEKETIAGFNAEKYTFKDQDGTQHELWATKDIQVDVPMGNGIFRALDAFPVKFEAPSNGVMTKFLLKSIKEDKNIKISMDIPSGYEVLTMEEFIQLQQMGRQ